MKPLPLTHTLVQADSRKTIQYKTTGILYETINAILDADQLIRGPRARPRMTIGKAIKLAKPWLTKREARYVSKELKTSKRIRGHEGKVYIDE